jgi:transposase
MSKKGTKAKIITGGRNKIQELIDKEKNATVRDRLRAILWSNNKVSNREIARRLGKNKNTIARWIDWWNKCEYQGLVDVTGRGRARLLTQEEEKEIIEMVKNQPDERYQGRITCKMLCAEIESRFGKKLSPEALRHYLKRNRLSWKKPGKYDYRRNEEHRQRFMWKLEDVKKKFEGKRVNMVYGRNKCNS